MHGWIHAHTYIGSHFWAKISDPCGKNVSVQSVYLFIYLTLFGKFQWVSFKYPIVLLNLNTYHIFSGYVCDLMLKLQKVYIIFTKISDPTNNYVHRDKNKPYQEVRVGCIFLMKPWHLLVTGDQNYCHSKKYKTLISTN